VSDKSLAAFANRLLVRLGSLGFGVVILLFLFVLSFFGTLAQTREGLYAVQEKYFCSWGLVHWLFEIAPLPLPGGKLLLWLLFVNLLCAAILAFRRGVRSGVLIAHVGILFLLLAVFVSYHYAEMGRMVLREGEEVQRFHSAHEWCLEIAFEGKTMIIDDREFRNLQGSQSRSFFAPDLPFELRLHGYVRNARPIAAALAGHGAQVVDGYALEVLPEEREMQQNVPGCYVEVLWRDGTTNAAILWGQARQPWTVARDGKAWQMDLTRRSWPLPFSLRLETFTRELYPGSSVPKVFRSNVTVLADGAAEPARIEMNAPLRRDGYALFQSSYGPTNAKPGQKLYSVISVVRNPADHWPMYASVVVGLALLLHYGLRLAGHLVRTNRGAAA
jgi:cytochrome c biogenesis protein ResB